jgi:hypothetical protein
MRKRLKKKRYIKAIKEFGIWYGKSMSREEYKTMYPECHKVEWPEEE